MPAATETLSLLECSRFLVGEFDFDFVQKKQITDIYHRLIATQPPNLLITPQRVRDPSLDSSLQQLVWAPETIESIFDLMLELASLVGEASRGQDLVVGLRERFFSASDYVNPYTSGARVCVLESLEPLVTSGLWVSQLLERAGARVPLNPTSPMSDAGAGAGGQQAHRVADPPRTLDRHELIGASLDALIVCLKRTELSESVSRTRAWIEKHEWVRDLSCIRSSQYLVVDGRLSFHDTGPSLFDTYQWLVAWLNDRPLLAPREYPCHPRVPPRV
ncbi:MAG: hypothetical protein ACF8GE_11895 [Phycisphaerales bacterium JB043]